MYWFSRPPYWRWIAAALLLVVAAYMDLTGPASVSYPFVAAPASAGEPVVVEWRDVPTGVLPPPGDPEALAATALDVGTPLVASAVSPVSPVPRDWWTVPADVPPGAVAGADILVVGDGLEVVGTLVAPGEDGAFGQTGHGVIAVPPEQAAAVASALAANRAIVLARP